MTQKILNIFKSKQRKYLLLVPILLLPLLLVFKPLIFNLRRTAPKTFLLGQDFSRQDRSQIESTLSSQYPTPQGLILQFQDSEVTLLLASISAQINPQKTASTLLYRHLNKGIAPYLDNYFSQKDFSLELDYDPTLLAQYAADYSKQFSKPFIPTEISLQNQSSQKEVQITQGQLGSIYDPLLISESILSHLSRYQVDTPLKILPSPDGALPSQEELETTQKKAQKLINKSLTLTLPDTDPVVIDDSTLVSWLNFDQSYQMDKISEYVNNLLSSLRLDPVNAVFTFENNQVTEFTPAKDGRDLDSTKLVELITTNLDQLFDSSEATLSFEIPFVSISPTLRTQDVNNLGIKELLGEGSSTFKHSSAIRNHNVKQGASIVNRVLVAPGEKFSFIESLGEVTLEAGYKNAYIIRAGRTELDVGGGICQVSTTLFRAMLNSGLDITERRHHAYRVSYYEEDMPPGYDATVFIPKPDLAFINDTGHHLLIQNTYDETNKKLTYQIYGTSDGRKAEITNYRQWGAAPAPPDVYIDDPTLESGKVVQVEHRVPGLKTAFDWKVVRDGETLHQQTFQSTYTPWAAVYRRGPQP